MAGGSREWPPPETDKILSRFSSKSAYVFEQFVNKGIAAGFYERSLGIPRGARFVNLKYDSIFDKQLHGPDGMFLGPDGRCWLIEAKSHADGRGRLGRIRFRGGRSIRQCSPEWLMKSMYEVAHQDPDRFAFIKQIAGEQSGLRNVLESVEYIQKNMVKILDEEGFEHLDAIRNFADSEQIKRILTNAVDENGQRLFNDEFLGKIGEFWGKFYNVGVVNKLGKHPGGISSVVSSVSRYAKTFGEEVVEAAERVNWEKFK